MKRFWKYIAAAALVAVAATAIPQQSINTALSYVQEGAGAIARSFNEKFREQQFSVKDFGAVCNYPYSNADDTSAIQRAIDAAYAKRLPAIVKVPGGSQCRTTAKLVMRPYVSLKGDGQLVSIIFADNTDAIGIDFVSGWGNLVIEDIGLEGINGTTRTAIVNSGSLTEADATYGVTISRNAIRHFNIGIAFRSVRNLNIVGNWIQYVNTGVELRGLSVPGTITRNVIERVSGNGTGSDTGVLFTTFDYTSGAGVASPEGIRVTSNTIYGFPTGVNFNSCTGCWLTNNDVTATSFGVKFSTVVGLRIRDNYIEVVGGVAGVGVWGPAQNSVINQNIVIDGNHILGSGGTTGSGVLLGTLSTGGNVDNVTISHNSFGGWTSSDVEIYASGNCYVFNNLMHSDTGVNPSFHATAIPTARPCYVHGNKMRSTLSYDSGDLVAGRLQLGPNLISGTTKSGWIFTTVSTAYDPPNLADGAGVTTTVTVTGAALGDYVEGVSFSLDLQGITLTAYVSAADTVAVRFQNESGGAVDLASGGIRLRVRQKDTGI